MSEDARARVVDVSSWQPSILWDQVPATIFGVYAKSSEGITYIDPEFKINMQKNKGKRMRGAYHFFRPSLSWASQAATFIKVIKDADPDGLELPPACDWEVTDGLIPVSRIPAWIAGFQKAVYDGTGKKPALYTGAWFLNQFSTADLQQLVSGSYLWLAEWPWNNDANFLANFATYSAAALTRQPTVPPPFTTWFAWQWCSRGNYPGIVSPYDPNYHYNVDCNVSAYPASVLGPMFGFGPTEPSTGAWKTDLDVWARGLGFKGAATSVATWQAEIDAWARKIGFTGAQP